jgi:hypothetical protein
LQPTRLLITLQALSFRAIITCWVPHVCVLLLLSCVFVSAIIVDKIVIMMMVSAQQHSGAKQLPMSRPQLPMSWPCLKQYKPRADAASTGKRMTPRFQMNGPSSNGDLPLMDVSAARHKVGYYSHLPLALCGCTHSCCCRHPYSCPWCCQHRVAGLVCSFQGCLQVWQLWRACGAFACHLPRVPIAPVLWILPEGAQVHRK